jgi:hypothetical protein
MTTPSNRTQLLRRYEADANICATDGEFPAMDFYSPFGPMIAKVTVPDTFFPAGSCMEPSRSAEVANGDRWLSTPLCLTPTIDS